MTLKCLMGINTKDEEQLFGEHMVSNRKKTITKVIRLPDV